MHLTYDRPVISLPTTAGAWATLAWGLGGVALVLLEAVVRLAMIAASVVTEELTPLQWVVALAWTAFMAYAEAWRGFHQRFSPRAVARALAVAERGTWWQVAAAPLVAMGLVHATRRRLVSTWLLVVGIVVMVLLVRALPEPWRAIADLGVVIGLGGGLLSLGIHTLLALGGAPPQVPTDLPE